MSDVVLAVQGHNGRLEVTDTILRIKRKGVMTLITQGVKGDKEILISQISAIQYKKASMLMNGYIQFSFVGGREAKRGILEATQDENTVMFRYNQQEAFEKLRDELQRRISVVAGETAPPSSMDELEKLALLRDKGIVTEDEFLRKKQQLLGL